MISPSKNPQKRATIGMRYVTVEEKRASVCCANLKKIMVAKAVPKTPSKVTYPKACQAPSAVCMTLTKSVAEKRNKPAKGPIILNKATFKAMAGICWQ